MKLFNSILAKFRKISVFALFFIAIFCISSCSVKNVGVDVPNNVEISELNLQKIRLKVMLPIDNPNKFSFTVNDADIDFFINDLNLGKINKIEKFKVEANSKKEYPIYIEILPKDIVGNVFSLLNDLKKDSPNVEIKGYLKVSKFGLPMRLKVSHKQDIKL
jgi:LEA14-like dessication related protein